MESPFRGPHPPGLKLIETFRWEPGAGFPRLDAHLGRMAASAVMLGFAFDAAAARQALAGVRGEAALRVRLTLDHDGRIVADAQPLGPAKPVWTLALANARLHSGDPWLRVKSTRRATHDRARAELPPGVDEALLLNERGEICEGTITNVFVEADGVLLTPPLTSGLLPGVLRADLLAAGTAREALIRPADLAEAEVFVGNALRGLIPARMLV